jgi:G3E family GTPase
MKKSQNKLMAIPTNIITGFLGVGKTSAILHLLQTKPVGERWAILVNEFGEIGVDGSLFQGQHSEDQQVFIREVPGGCMCCAAGLPMQIALNQLLTRARPHRLLIEPTGLGHPIEILEILTADHYREVLSIQKTLTLVDARKLDDSRYTQHDIFNQQISIADIVIGNKKDLYSEQHFTNLREYIKPLTIPTIDIVFSEQGKIPIDLLAGPTAVSVHAEHNHHDEPSAKDLIHGSIPECGYLKAVNKGEGFHSVGWRFEPNKIFNRDMLFSFLKHINAERMKAVFITNEGVFGYNLTSDALTETALDECLESRIEIIASSINNDWEATLFSCIHQG